MKKFYAIVIMVAALVACSKEEQSQIIDRPSSPNTYSMTIKANKSADTKALYIDGNILKTTWVEGEEVTVYNITRNASLGGTLKAQSSGAFTILEGTVTGTVENGDELKLKFLNPSYSSQSGTLEYIAANCDYAEATTTVSNISNGHIIASGVTFSNKQAIVKFSFLEKSDGTTPVKVTTLTIEDGANTYTVTPASATDVVFVAIPAINSQTVTLTASDGMNSYTYERPGSTFVNGKCYDISVKLTNDTNYLTIPLTFEAKVAGAEVIFGLESQGTWGLPNIDVEYSLNGGNWTDYTGPITLDNIGDRVSFRGDNPDYGNNAFTCSDECYIYGNIMSLVSKDNYATTTQFTKNFVFSWLFSSADKLFSHPSKTMVLPATTLTKGCYMAMFAGCSNLTKAPALPAETLAERCYVEMFRSCTSLESAPELPAETLTYGCYTSMFYNCTSLTHAPELPAETLTGSCYAGMFYNCTSLNSTPSLPAMVMAPSCYQGMFSSCSGLTTAPVLPATTMADQCYLGMFADCSNLAVAPALPATTLAPFCYDSMFSNCTSLTTSPVLPATTLSMYCYQYMFCDCTSLRNVTCLATSISAEGCTNDWLNNVAETGTFTKAASTNWNTGTSGIPSGWTAVNN